MEDILDWAKNFLGTETEILFLDPADSVDAKASIETFKSRSGARSISHTTSKEHSIWIGVFHPEATKYFGIDVEARDRAITRKDYRRLLWSL